ncbi:MAG: hypothetical protein GXY74_06610 [Phycisphaerae bacterium]|nr:hypothetical protein [Phycisphaerae bacterium]
MTSRMWAVVAVVSAACLGLGGCAEPNYTAPERYGNGLVLVFDGAGGITRAPVQIRRGLHEGGVDHAIEIVDWTAGHNVLEDQTNLERNRGVARQSSDRIARYVAEHPGRPVHLIGISAGTGIVVFAAEQLPAGVKVDGLVLMASSLTNTYNLAPAMNRVRNDITNFSSVADVGVLGVGVGLAGTVDRGSGVAAGLYGFRLPEDASAQVRALYQEKLVEVPWTATHVIFGHMGDHLGASSSGFVKRFVAPIVLDASRLRAGEEAAAGAAAKTDMPRTQQGDSSKP